MSSPSAEAAQQRGAWRGGWWQPARKLPSPNHDLRPPGSCIDLIVVHSISLPPGRYGTGDVQRLFTNRLDWSAHPYFEQIRGLRVSSHFFVARDGTPWQFVDADHRAWHAGVSRYRGRAACNDDSIGIELEGLEGHGFAAPQYRSLLALCAALRRRYPIAWLAGHEHIAPSRKGDPGAAFDWPSMWREFAGSGIALPPGTAPHGPCPPGC